MKKINKKQVNMIKAIVYIAVGLAMPWACLWAGVNIRDSVTFLPVWNNGQFVLVNHLIRFVLYGLLIVGAAAGIVLVGYAGRYLRKHCLKKRSRSGRR